MLDLGDGPGSRPGHPLLLDHFPLGVEVAQVVRRDRPQVLDQRARQTDLVRERVSVSADHFIEHVAPVDPHRPDPGEVVQANLVDQHPLGWDAEVSGDLALKVDRDVAKANRAMARVE